MAISRPPQGVVRKMCHSYAGGSSCHLAPRNSFELTNLEMKAVYGLHPEIWPKKLAMDMEPGAGRKVDVVAYVSFALFLHVFFYVSEVVPNSVTVPM